MQQPLVPVSPSLPRANRPRFRPPLLATPAALGALLAVLLAAESLLGDTSATTRSLVIWSVLVLLVAPLIGLLTWRAIQADALAALAAERELADQLAQDLAAEPDHRRVPEQLLRLLCELTGAQRALLASPQSDGFQVSAVYGARSGHLLGQRLPIDPEGQGIGAEALRTGRPVVLPETWSEPGLRSRSELALADRTRSAAVIPLFAAGSTLGLIVLHAEQPGQLEPVQERLLALCGLAASGPLAAARLRLELEAAVAAGRQGAP